MQSGSFEIVDILQSVFGLDGGAMFGIVPKPLWNKIYPADDMNRIDMAGRIFILRYKERVVLIEAGMGTKYDEKFKKIYNIRVNNLSELLGRYYLDESLVTDVIISHLHFDHAGGLTKREGNIIIPTYPNARIYIQKSQLENAFNPSIKDRGSYLRDDFEFLKDYKNLVCIEGEYELIKGVRIKPVDGHTYGMQTLYIDTGVDNFIFTADLIPTARHIKIPYIMAYDLNPMKTIEEKRELLIYALKNDSILLFPHDIFTSAAKIDKKNNDFEVKEEIKL